MEVGISKLVRRDFEITKYYNWGTKKKFEIWKRRSCKTKIKIGVNILG